MVCKRDDIKEMIPAYIENVLDETSRKTVEAHIDTCPDCRRELTMLRMMAEDGIPDPGEAFWKSMPHRVRETIEREKIYQTETGISGLSRILDLLIRPRWAWAVAATVLAAIMVWVVAANRQVEMQRGTSFYPEAYLEEEGYYQIFGPGGLDKKEMESLSAWADTGLSVIAEDAAVVLNNTETDMYEDLFSLNAGELKRLRYMIDELKQEV